MNAEPAPVRLDPLTQVRHAETVTAAPDDAVLVVDGVFAFRREINRFWDFRVWLHVDEETSLRRGLRRDGRSVEAIQRDRYAVAERLYLREEQPVRSADVVVDNTVLDRPGLLGEP